MSGPRSTGIETLRDLIEALQDFADEYPDHADDPLVVRTDDGDMEGHVGDVDYIDGAWVVTLDEDEEER